MKFPTGKASIIKPDHHFDTSNIPDGWVWATIGAITQLNPPKPAQDELPPDGQVSFVPMTAVDAKTGTFEKPENRNFESVRKGYSFFCDKDVIFAKITPCMENGKAAIAQNLTNGMGFGSTEFHVLRSVGAVLPKYLFLFIRQESFRRLAEENMTGSVGQRRVPASFLENAKIPLPPLPEQKRIVSKVEEVLGRVNSVRERLARVQAILKRFRQSVLSAACSGRLTSAWRNVNYGIKADLKRIEELLPFLEKGKRPEPTESIATNNFEIPDTWVWASLGKMAAISRGRFSVRPRNDPRYYGGRYPFVQIGDLPSKGGEIAAYQQTLNEKGLSTSKIFPSGTVLIAIVGATIGNTGILTFDCCCPDSMVAIRGVSESHSRFIEYYLRLEKMKIREASYASGGQPNINLQTLIPLPIPLPPLAEIDEAVRSAERLFKLADLIETRLMTAAKRAGGLPQAILAKAFRGELVPTEAELARREGRSYEPTSSLLARIRAERDIASAPVSKKRKRRL